MNIMPTQQRIMGVAKGTMFLLRVSQIFRTCIFSNWTAAITVVMEWQNQRH
uniref:Uncharacterized protein n=1 Tax=Arundo donax TaxID=35708 RepID=A0A0A9D7V2_ARUDO